MLAAEESDPRYQAVLARLAARGRFGIRLGLGRTRALLKQMGDPHIGLPGVLIGASQDVAWGATVSNADQSDWVVVEVDPSDPTRYRTPEGFEPFVTGSAEIAVAGGAPVRIEIGPRDLEKDSVFLGRRDKGPKEKSGMPRAELLANAPALLQEIQDALFARANAGRAASVTALFGPCLHVARACIGAVGDVRAVATDDGHASEDDFALRARAAGFEVKIAGDVFVRNDGEGSFGDRAMRVETHAARPTLAAARSLRKRRIVCGKSAGTTGS